MIIGVDVDDVLADFTGALLPHLNGVYKTSIVYEEIHSMRLERVWRVPAENIKRHIHDFIPREAKILKPYLDAFAPLVTLKSAGHEAQVVTSRPSFIRDDTINWVEEHFRGIFSRHHVTNQYGEGVRTTKQELCLKEGIGLLIDDNPEYATNCSRNGIKVVLIDRPWNRTLKENSKIIRVAGWAQVESAIERLI